MTWIGVYELLGRRGRRRVSIAICFGLVIAPAPTRTLVADAARSAGQSAAADWQHLTRPLTTTFKRSVQQTERRDHRQTMRNRRAHRRRDVDKR